MNFQIYLTRQAAREQAKLSRNTGWPEAKAVQVLIQNPADPQGDLLAVWVVQCTDQPTYIRSDGMVR